MKNLIKLQLPIIVFLMFPLSALACNSVDEIKTNINGRSESVSSDARRDVKRFGVRIGCEGNTFKADVRAINAEVVQGGNNLEIFFQYSGNYQREKFDVPCVETAEENRFITGTYRLTLQTSLLATPKVVDERIENFGEVSDPNHDSNIFAKLAARQLITNACGFNVTGL
ncbi:hypothetical protein [Nostoc sp. FACHB-888]|uniref:hypothetical protein n=1 Tax=Nostoc sp. FACHB-888 TaxID=2692842 RepID=UPI00168746E2|nr:hypothetical protein [Nostoc sp. FACHB-888]MBD2247337.1 hypothetical protein [Nostoc sp. FACHB-888]